MNDVQQQEKLVRYVKRLATDLDATRARLKEYEDRAHEPLAVVGMSCRYPGGVTSPEELWQLVAEGRIGTADEFPADRGWDVENLYHPDPDHPGTSYTRGGGFLDAAADFDADFFEISPREALVMDPQQRLLLESAWEAFEDAGMDITRLRGSDTGVFCGVMYSDYGFVAGTSDRRPEVEGYLSIASAGSVASGRVSYTFGFTGPAVTVDTACSSSLVAVHLAAQALRARECSLALVGGVTVLARPNVFVEFSRQRGVSPDGRCKAYAAAADGVGWAEGAGLLVLERLSDARRNGHQVLAVLRGSAVNQDGASNGLTAPNGPSQERVIRQALADAGLRPADVDAVEGHGTGTPLGDPIEAKALLATYGRERENGPLRLGSVKSNIGHTQAAAGVAGVIKMIMALRNGTLPRTLHVDAPSPNVDWTAGEVSLLTEAQPWPSGERPRRAGVSSFGVGGTNAHVILEEAPAEQAQPAGQAAAPLGNAEASTETPDAGGAPPQAVPVLLSARSDAALRAQADRLRALMIARPGLSVLDLGLSSSTLRAHLDRRAAVVATDRGALLSGLKALSAAEPAAHVLEGRVTGNRAVFVFPGQGAQWERMAVDLLDSSPVFATELAACGKALAAYVDWQLEDVLRGTPGAPTLERVDVVQPALFAVMVSLAALWQSYGVVPEAVLGHSQGEIAAACVAGALSLDDAARVVALRSRAIREHLAGKGGMASVALPVDRVEELIEPYGGRVSVAAVNGPAAVVVSGAPEALDELAADCGRAEIRFHRVSVDYASHSAQVEEIEAELLDVLGPITPRTGRIPFYSTLRDRFVDTTELDASYWYQNLRGQVRFESGVRALIDNGMNCFIEVSPHPVLKVPVEEAVQALDAGDRATVLGSLRRGEGGFERFATSLAEAHTLGTAVDWARFYADSGARHVPLPTYAFQRERYWMMPGSVGDPAAAGLARFEHPLLTASVRVGDRDEWLFTGRVSQDAQPWTQDHAVLGTVLLPGAALVELALTVGADVGCPVVEELVLQAPLVLAEDAARQLQVTVGAPDEDGRREIAVYSRPEAAETAETAVCHARGWLGTDAEPARPFGTQWPPSGAQAIGVDALYPRLAAAGYEYGPVFQGLRSAWRAGEDVYAEVELAEGVTGAGFGVHPALFDAVLHAALVERDAGAGVELPFAWSGVRLGHGGAGSRVRVRIGRSGGSAMRVDVVDGRGVPVVAVESLSVRPVDQAQLAGAVQGGGHNALFGLEWVPVTDVSAVDSSVPSAVSVAVLGGLLPAAGERYPDLAALERAVTEGAAAPDVVLVGVEPDRTTDVASAARAATASTLELVQRWLAGEVLRESRLVVVTRNAVAVGEQAPDLAQAPIWGLVRSAQSEHPGRFTLVDVDVDVDADVDVDGAGDGDGDRHGDRDWAALSALGAEEPQIAVRGGTLLVPRLARTETAPVDGAWHLGSKRRGSLEDLAILPSNADRPLGVHEVRIGIRAAGLNFRDVLIALGTYPGEAPLGSEAAGVVLEVGAEVTDLAPGDRVFGLVLEAFGPVAVADRRTIVPMPDSFSFVQAAALPVVYLTAYYGLVDLAGLRRGERLLVHAAAGGVGMAAVQLARHWGVEVLATASEPKWDAVRALGVAGERIGSSRDLSFREKFLDVTDGAGVDVVLNALAGEFIDASLDLLPRGGRFVEMGKADLRDPDIVAADHQGVRYRSYDLVEAGPDRIQEMLSEIVSLFEQGVLEHAPVRTWDVRRGAEAFRFLREGRNTGKVVLTVPAPLDQDGTVLITGGTGGLGALFAKHLARRYGVKHLLLVSRRGPAADGVPELLAELAELGAEARAAACDVSDRDQLGRLLDQLEHPLRAVIHSAGVLDDGVVESLTPEQVERVMRPKVDAALHLHELTADMDLSAFVLFSSLAALIGSPGQANYAAANATLDALAAVRRAQGLPAGSLAWGLWGDATGMTGELGEAGLARLERMGVAALPNELGLQLFDAAQWHGEALLVPARLDQAALRAQAQAGRLPALLRGLVRAPARRTETVGGSLADRLAAVEPSEWEGVTLDLVRAQVASVLGHASAEAVDPDRAFKELGFDSLAAVELRNRLTSATGLRLPTTLVFDHPNPLAVARYLIPAALPDSAPADTGRRSEEEEIRDLLVTIPIGRLRQSGLLDALLDLANGEPADTRSDDADGDAVSIDEMDVAALIRMTQDDVE
ncbi:type I polyketide synthase [Streptomyces lasalocidi]|uniref:Putative modular polyketide synthase n=1 Tax=Streptomyces lasalocidi TaxID=324833 RepID=A0A0A8JEG1_STRLS|nr:type I polyketide synthase [Streptomyces lasalocidi]BAQ03813.1 putative modular polyketide synthase [Streptomyces lasalocidi]